MTGRSPTSPPPPKAPTGPGTADPRSRAIGRRALLTGAGAGGVAAAVVAAGVTAPERAGEPETTDRDPVYRETEHIRQFYARSRF